MREACSAMMEGVMNRQESPGRMKEGMRDGCATYASLSPVLNKGKRVEGRVTRIS